MVSSTLPDPIVCIAPEALHERLDRELPGSDELWTIVGPAETNGALERPRPELVVVSTTEPEAVDSLVNRVRSVRSTVPIVLSPLSGSERLATAAVRANVTDYVPCSRADALADRLEEITDDAAVDTVSGFDRSNATESTQMLTDSLPVEAFVIDDTGTFLEAHIRPEASERYETDPESIVGETLGDVFSPETATELNERVRVAISTETVQTVEYDVETPGGRFSFEARVYPIDDVIDGRRSVIWLAREITDRVRRERSLRQQRDQLETLNRINGVVQRVVQTLVEAPTRAEIEREVCQRLVESELYCGAWIGERTGDDEVSQRTAAGDAERYLDALSTPSIIEDCPGVSEVLHSGESRTTNRILEHEAVPDAIREVARADEVSSVTVVPIRYDETIYGVLCVLAHRDDAFSDREESAFAVLGEIIGFSINAVMNRRLLFADTILELELVIEDGDSFTFDLTERYDCSTTLEWTGTTTEGYLHQYISVDGLDGDTVLSVAREHESVESCRLVHDGSDQCTIELRLEESGLRLLTNYGATLRKAGVDNGVATIQLEVSRNVNLRQLLESFRTVYPKTQLVAKREVEREVATAAERRERVLDSLTDRQLTALSLAYYGGYFDWPRGTTGEEIADRMDVTPPTMHQHLRGALGRLLHEFFDHPD